MSIKIYVSIMEENIRNLTLIVEVHVVAVLLL